MLTDWIMIIITGVYVVATIFICIFNYLAAKRTHEQTIEIKRQYDDEKRWKMMPYIQLKHIKNAEHINGRDSYFFNTREDCKEIVNSRILFEVKNVGYGIAKEIDYKWEENKRSGWRISSLTIGDTRVMEVMFYAPKSERQLTYATLYISFEDLLNNKYNQEISIRLEITDASIKYVNTVVKSPYLVREKMNTEAETNNK